MLRKVEVENFKLFKRQTFEIPRHLVVVGPNNGGKTSLLQAVATWAEVAEQWFEISPDFARLEDDNYPSVDLNLSQFNAVPLANFPHLWANKLVEEPIRICLYADGWQVGFEIVYLATQLASVRPAKDVAEADLEKCLKNRPTVLYAPPVWRLKVDEKALTEDAVRAMLRRGEVAEVLRNVLLAVSRHSAKWKQLQEAVRSFFGYELFVPSAGAEVIALYRHRPDGEAYDLSSAASGFLQVLAVYATLLFDDASVVMIDEPDAHLHLLLQEKLYRDLREFATKGQSQLLVATHSEVLIQGAPPEDLRLLWQGFRPVLRGQKLGPVLRVGTEKLMLAETEPGILYVEGESDLDILREWARVVAHPLWGFLDKPFYDTTASSRGGDSAKADFQAMRMMVPTLKGIELRDGDTRQPEGGPAGMRRLRWVQTEIEFYLLHPAALERFLKTECESDAAERGMVYMRSSLPPALFDAPFENRLIATTKESTVLDGILQEAGLRLEKTKYWRIAAQMRPEEVHPEVREKLDAIAAHFGIGGGTGAN